MQIGVDTAVALRRHPIKLTGGEAFGFGQKFLMVGALFIVILIHTFEWTAVDEKRLEAVLQRGHGGQGVHSEVQSRKE